MHNIVEKMTSIMLLPIFLKIHMGSFLEKGGREEGRTERGKEERIKENYSVP